jgi:phosphatidylglycerophosphatase C
MNDRTIAVFDFDGTITTKDTFLPFLFKAFGHGRVFKELARLGPEVMLVGIGVSNLDSLKEHLVQLLFSGESVERLKAIGTQYANTLKPLLRPSALKRIEWHKSKGHRCVMVSASLDLYLTDVAKALGFNDLLCTVLSHNNQVFSGTFKEGNCRSKEKMNRLQPLLGDLKTYKIYAYGDSFGDLDIIALADYGYYCHFET